jgi:ribose 5-phosphate isomerase A
MTSTPLPPVEAAKRAAAYRAVKDHFPENPTYVGIGSGSTVIYVVEAIAALGQKVTDSITFVPTGFQSRELIVEAGLKLGGIDSLVPINAGTGMLVGGKLGANAHAVASGTLDLGLGGERAMLDVAFDGADEVDDELNCIKGGGACLFQEKLVAISAKKFIIVAGKFYRFFSFMCVCLTRVV